jgi:hypothetical protein
MTEPIRKRSYWPAALLLLGGLFVCIFGAYAGLYNAWRTALPGPPESLETLQARALGYFALSLAGLFGTLGAIALAFRVRRFKRIQMQ